MNKKAIAILGAIFILIVGTLGFLIYSKYSSKKTADSTSSPIIMPGMNPTVTPLQPIVGSNATSTPTQQATPKVVRLTQEPAVAPVLFFNGNGVTYFTNDGQLWQADLQTNNGLLQLANKKNLNIHPKPNISKILWPKAGDNFIAEFDQGGSRTWSFYDSKVGSFTDLPGQIGSVDWMPNGSQVIYTWVNQGKETLNSADPNLKNYKHIADMWQVGDDIKVSPDGNNILFYQSANTTSAVNKITLTTTDGKTWKDLVKEGYNIGALWSPDGQKFLFNKKDLTTQKYQLWYYNIMTGEIKNLGLLTLLDKVVWTADSQSVYAAVPGGGATIGNALTTDDVFQLDTVSLVKKQYDTSGIAVDGQNLFLNSDGTKLFFKNAQDGSLYYLDLTQ